MGRISWGLAAYCNRRRRCGRHRHRSTDEEGGRRLRGEWWVMSWNLETGISSCVCILQDVYLLPHYWSRVLGTYLVPRHLISSAKEGKEVKWLLLNEIFYICIPTKLNINIQLSFSLSLWVSLKHLHYLYHLLHQEEIPQLEEYFGVGVNDLSRSNCLIRSSNCIKRVSICSFSE